MNSTVHTAETPLISIVICTLNRAKYLQKTLTGLLDQDQSRGTFEVIIVDNGSVDNTISICKRFEEDLNLRYMHESQTGLSICRNRGCNEAAGRIIAFLDDDAIPSRGWLNEIVESFQSDDNIGCVGGKNSLIWEKKRPAWLVDGLLTFFGHLDLGNRKTILSSRHVYGCNMAFLADAIREAGGFDSRLGLVGNEMFTSEEIQLQDRIRLNGYQICYSPKMQVKHHVQAEKVSKKWFLKRFTGQGRSLARMSATQKRKNGIGEIIASLSEIENIAKNDPSPHFQKAGHLIMKNAYLMELISNMEISSSKSILLLTHGTYFDPQQVSTGNSIRAFYLSKALVENGFDVIHCFPCELDQYATSIKPIPGVKTYSYANKAELQGLIDQYDPKAILLGYWELVHDLPEDISVPIIADVSTPRVLEVLVSGKGVDSEIDKIFEIYPRIDIFLCGNKRQRDFLLPWLMVTGFDLSERIPILNLPLSTQITDSKVANRELHFISGGVIYPWRNPEKYHNIIRKFLRSGKNVNGSLTILKGSYPYKNSAHEEPTTKKFERVYPLLPYNEMSNLYTQSTIGLELSEENIEREFSQSFRIIEYLRHGLPVICNGFLEISHLIEKYNAGWVIDSPTELDGLLNSISSDPSILIQMSKNAQKLIEENFHYQDTIDELLVYLQNPVKAIKSKLKYASSQRRIDQNGQITVKILSDW